MKIMDMFDKCLVQKQFKQYTTRVEQVDLEIVKEDMPNTTEDMNVQFSLTFGSNTVDIFEEILIVDGISLLGSLGGSLGLFIGFSFFGYITSFLDVIVEKMFFMSIKWIKEIEIHVMIFISFIMPLSTRKDSFLNS